VKRAADLSSRPPSKGAFTLIEVCVALLILGVALLGLMALQVRAVRSNAFSNSMTVASCVARNQIERLRARSSADWESVPDGTFSETIPYPPGQRTRMVLTREWEVETDANRIRNVSVLVSWNQGGDRHDVEMSTRIARRD
jgi:prepilin-type N-terminal cleavage/methylation domain-containing protein